MVIPFQILVFIIIAIPTPKGMTISCTKRALRVKLGFLSRGWIYNSKFLQFVTKI
jgi:hypothetical protein